MNEGRGEHFVSLPRPEAKQIFFSLTFCSNSSCVCEWMRNFKEGGGGGSGRGGG